MRSKLFSKIQGNKNQPLGFDSRVISSLILNHMTTEGFKYSVSVFVPECGENMSFLSPLELAEHFKFDSAGNGSVLQFILANYSFLTTKPHKKDSSTQALSPSPVRDLENKLLELDKNFALKKSLERPETEEKILKIQRDCETRMKAEVQEHVKRIRESEIISLKLEESNKYQQLLQKYKDDNEKFYQRELEALRTKEKKLQDQLRIKEQELEHKSYIQRQEYLQDVQSNNDKLSELRKKLDLELEEAEMCKRVWQGRVNEYETKIKELDLNKKEISLKINEEFLKCKLEFEQKFEEEKRQVASEKIEIEGIKRTWNLDSDRLRNSEDRLEVYSYQLNKLTEENMSLKTKNYNQEKDLDQLRCELKILSESQNRLINELGLRDHELQVMRDEFESFKKIYEELKDRMARIKIEHEIEIEKYKKEINENTGKMFVSSYLQERKVYWNKLHKEEIDLKKDMMDMIKPGPLYSVKAALKEVKKTDVKVEKREMPQVVAKTQFAKQDYSDSESI